MLILFANDEAYLSMFHSENGRRVAVAALHEIDQAVGQARLYLPNIFPGRITNHQGMSIDMELHSIANAYLGKYRGRGDINQLGHACFARLFNEEPGIDTFGSSRCEGRRFLK